MDPAQSAPGGDANRLLSLIQQGEPAAAEQLLPLVYGELRQLAGGYMRDQPAGPTMQPTALVHEAYLKLINHPEPRSRAHFMAVAATAMRQILTDRARARRTDKRGGGWTRISLDDASGRTGWSEVDPVELDDILDELARLDSRHARIVQLRFFGGLSTQEVADVLGVSRTTVDNEWRVARAWLSGQLAARSTP